ncbi:MAG TPA: FG-GAP-like repeat-containing protein, partial [Nevskia sp.]|nr:FG-GAP-like repeat-containing protein [Nevskia sp.]
MQTRARTGSDLLFPSSYPGWLRRSRRALPRTTTACAATLLGLWAALAQADVQSFSVSDASLPRPHSGSANMRFTITRNGDSSAPLAIQPVTYDITATAGKDYTALAPGFTLNFAAQQSPATVDIPILGSTLFNNDLTFELGAFSTTGILGAGPNFTSPAAFGAGTAPQAVAFGDLNGDGKPDLVVANAGSGTISVLLNTTAPGAALPSFAAAASFSVGSGPHGLAFGDFNGDGRPDLVVANSGSGNVSVLFNTTATGAATPSFAAAASFAAGGSPFGVAVGDVNGDGKPDIAVANNGSGNVSVL